jgi:type II secretory pathway pseudopilin PulG
MIVCPYCQSQNADGSPYCAGCGQPLTHAPAPRPAHAYGRPQGPTRNGLAIASLVLGLLGLPLLFCFGIGFLFSLVGLILGIVALVKASRYPHVYGGKGLAIGGVVASGMSVLALPVVAAIAIPSLLRARVSASEAAAIGDIRTVISAQAQYASVNGGFYDTLECLASPPGCLPGNTANARRVIDPALAQATVKQGYRRTLHLGPAVDPAQLRRPVSASSVVAFAYVAVPVTVGQTGVRSFCGDDRGLICYKADGSEPPVENGRCADPCTSIR